MEKNYILYKATCKLNGKAYIGYTRDLTLRKVEHKSAAENKHTNFIFHKAIRKYGFNNFDWKIIEETSTLELACKREKYLIEEYNTHYLEGSGYNMTFGGEGNGGYIYTDEVKKKMSDNHAQYFLGREFTEEHKKNISKAKLGVPKPKDSIERYRQARLKNSHKYETEAYKKNLSNAVKAWWAKRKEEQLSGNK